MKKCSKCKLEKDVEDFHVNNRNKDKLGYYCKPCARQISKEHHRNVYKFKRKALTDEQKERNKLYMREYRAKKMKEDPEGFKEYMKHHKKKYSERKKYQEFKEILKRNESNITSNI